jgi:predicted AAA+ superfamily ATPase
MKRFITDNLISWKTRKDRKPLIIRGARQVGKSYIINDLGKEHFNGRIHTVNFEKHQEWHGIFDLNLDVKRILSELEIILNSRIETGKDLLFFDEIQSCPRAILSLRYFYEDLPEQHIIAAGSLLEFAFQDISIPVGRVQFLNMYPMNFPEYLFARGKEKLAEIIMSVPEALPETIHNTLLGEIRNYFIIGGMPESVKRFIETDRLRDSLEIQKDLTNTFREDFSKYAPLADKRCLNSVLSSVAKHVGSQIKYTHLSDQFSVPTIKKAFDLLHKARIITKVLSASPAGLPLEASASDKKFKAILLDIGIMQQLCGMTVDSEFFSSDILDIYRGSMAEQFIGQELISAGNDPIYYWAREAKSSTAEVDYLFSKKNKIYPVEIKSGASGRLRSMHLLLNTYPNCPIGFVFSDAPYGEIKEQRLSFLPVYYSYQVGLELKSA